MARKVISAGVVASVRDQLVGDVNALVAQDPDPKRALDAEMKLSTYRRLRIELLTYVEHMRKELQ